jgi:hypothetical protein
MMLQALNAEGGARENPNSFMALLGRILPMQVDGTDGGPGQVLRPQNRWDQAIPEYEMALA